MAAAPKTLKSYQADFLKFFHEHNESDKHDSGKTIIDASKTGNCEALKKEIKILLAKENEYNKEINDAHRVITFSFIDNKEIASYLGMALYYLVRHGHNDCCLDLLIEILDPKMKEILESRFIEGRENLVMCAAKFGNLEALKRFAKYQNISTKFHDDFGNNILHLTVLGSILFQLQDPKSMPDKERNYHVWVMLKNFIFVSPKASHIPDPHKYVIPKDIHIFPDQLKHHIECLDFLLRRMKSSGINDRNIIREKVDEKAGIYEGLTPLFAAILICNKEMIALLVENNAILSEIDKKKIEARIKELTADANKEKNLPDDSAAKLQDAFDFAQKAIGEHAKVTTAKLNELAPVEQPISGKRKESRSNDPTAGSIASTPTTAAASTAANTETLQTVATAASAPIEQPQKPEDITASSSIPCTQTVPVTSQGQIAGTLQSSDKAAAINSTEQAIIVASLKFKQSIEPLHPNRVHCERKNNDWEIHRDKIKFRRHSFSDIEELLFTHKQLSKDRANSFETHATATSAAVKNS